MKEEELNVEKRKRNSVMDKKAFFENKQNINKTKPVVNKTEDKNNPRIEEKKIEVDNNVSTLSNNDSQTSLNESIEIKKRGYSFKDKISMFSIAGTAPKKVINVEDEVLAKSTYVKVIDETTKKMKWAEAPVNHKRSNEEVKLVCSEKNENNRNIANNEIYVEKITVKQNKFPNEVEGYSSSEEKGIDFEINENDDTIAIEEQLKENIEERILEYNYNIDKLGEIKREKIFNLYEEMEKTDILGKTKEQRNTHDLNYLISTPKIQNKTIINKFKNIKPKFKHDNSLIYDRSSKITDRIKFNNYAQINTYIKDYNLSETRKDNEKEIKLKISPLNRIDKSPDEQSSHINNVNLNETHHKCETINDFKRQTSSDSKRNYNILNNESFLNITKNSISQLEPEIKREKRNSSIIINIVDFYYKFKTKITILLTIIIILIPITIVTFLIILRFKKKNET